MDPRWLRAPSSWARGAGGEGRAAGSRALRAGVLAILTAAAIGASVGGCGDDTPCGCYEGTMQRIGTGGTFLTIMTCTEKTRATQHYCDCTTSDPNTLYDDQPTCP